MLSIVLTELTEADISGISARSGVNADDVRRVLSEILLNSASHQASTVAGSEPPRYATRPDLTQEQFVELINSFGKRTPPGASSLEGVDIRELAYADD